MPKRDGLSPRLREVWDRLDRVCDPELDEPVTAMGFVETVAVDGDDVRVFFRLPTYWCSPNFAFLMAEGIHDEVSALPWVSRVRVRLEDHLCAAELNAAVNEGRSFSEAFALHEEGGDLAAVKEKFDRKAFQRRQETVIAALRKQGLGAKELSAMTLADLDACAFEEEEPQRQKGRYREILVRRGLASMPHDAAFPDLDGMALSEATFADRMHQLRAVRINMEFGGALCRGLLESRYKEVACVDGEPTLVDFMLGRVPPSEHGQRVNEN